MAILWCWGSDSNGVIGIGVSLPDSYPAPTQVGNEAGWRSVDGGAYSACATRLDNTLGCWGDDGRCHVGTEAVWRSVSTFLSHTCAIRTEASLWCWGNIEGRVGPDASADSSTPVPFGVGETWWQVSAGGVSTIALAL